MNRLLMVLCGVVICSGIAIADELIDVEQIIKMSENKVILNVQKQHLNEH